MSQGQTTINYKDENFEYKTSKASLYVDFSLKFHSGALFLSIAEIKTSSKTLHTFGFELLHL